MALFSQISPLPVCSPGAIWKENRLQFSIYTEIAEEIEYFFYARPYQLETGHVYPLLERVILSKELFCFGGLWNWTAQFSEEWSDPLIGYLIRIWKKNPVDGKMIFRWITDPYSRESTGGEEWGRSYNFQINPKDFSLCKTLRSSENFTKHPRRLTILRSSSPHLPPIPRPNHPLETSVIYECHVRSMTQSPSTPLSNPLYAGTYRGLVEQIPYFLELGITAIELLPVYDFDETENRKHSPLTGERLFNYWGYSPLSFFAPKQSYAFDRQNPIDEFKNMVNAFHQAGLEIILDVVYNHTAELDEEGPIDHFKWLGEKTWYLHDDDQRLTNHSGCGNTLKCAHFPVKQVILASLRYWANEIGVDGFRFDLSSILARNSNGDLQPFSSLQWEIRHDPLLENIKLIAEPWDAGGGYQLGQTAHYVQWSEWNDRYRDTMRKALRGDEGIMAEVKNCIWGSPDLFKTPQKGRCFSINFITAHDGMTMWDLVSYNEKHNAINGEGNQDGTTENYSYNCGEEGNSSNLEIQILRHKKVKTFHLLLQLSGGIPMLLSGDEIARSQQGNNNAYCLDNEINWIDWDLLKNHPTLFQFVKNAIAFRKTYFAFLFSKKSRYQWYNSLGKTEDLRHHIRTLVWKITHPDFSQKAICVMLNCYHAPLEFYFPDKSRWRYLFNTAQENDFPNLTIQSKATLDGFSMQVFEKV